MPSVFLALLPAKMHNPVMIDWNDLRFLLAVARAGSTAGAARALGVNQSTVVRRIAMLEAGLELRLFTRKRDGYSLTQEGEALLPDAAAVEAAVHGLTRRATALDGALTGTLRVTTVALGVMPQLVHAFQQRHPGLKVRLLIEDRYNDLSDGTAEVALRAGPPGDSTLIGRKLSDQAWAVYGSESYVARAGIPTTLEDLGHHCVIGFEGPIENIMAARWLRRIAPGCEIVCRSDSVLGLLQAAQTGFGLALLPCEIGDPDPGLIRVIDPQPDLIAGCWILTHPDLHRQPKIRAFFDFMVEQIAQYRPLLLGHSLPARPGVLPPPLAGSTIEPPAGKGHAQPV